MSEEELSPGPSTGEMGDDDTESTRTPQEENEVSPGKSTSEKAEGITETNGTSRIFLLHKAGLNFDENLDIIELRHPSTDGPGMFLLSADNTVIQEVQTFSDDLRSWFIDETVKSDGDLFVTTPIDPLFLALSYFVKVGRCMPLDQILTDDEFPQTQRLLDVLKPASLSQIADMKGPESVNAWMLNEEKLLSWLKAKTMRVADVLKLKRTHVGPMAVSNTFVKSKEDTPENYLKYAHGIISEYLPEELSKKLSTALGIPAETDLKRKKPQSDVKENKKPKLEKVESEYFADSVTSSNSDSMNEEKPPPTPKQTISSKDKARAVAAKGSKSISSFFTKKS
nr:PREDICTED: ribonuclease H2 subunit B-like [Bemisia tabaci]